MTTFMAEPQVLIAGGGIGGMAPALTLHQIGVPCVVYEAVADPQPLGVGINLQPNAVRELYDLGIDSEMLDSIASRVLPDVERAEDGIGRAQPGAHRAIREP